MKITPLKKEVSISINGKHYFGCDYIFSNIYGSCVFSDENNPPTLLQQPLEEMSQNPENGDYNQETLNEFIRTSAAGAHELLSLPECNKEIEYSTTGTIQSDGENGYLIRYSGDFTDICIHAQDGKMTLNGQEDDFSELIFEKGKRNYIALPESLFFEDDVQENENQSPFVLCLSAECVENSFDESGGVLHVSYSIEVNGITAEVTDFTLTAISDNHNVT